MTYLDIVTKAIVEVFGSDDPQAEVTTNLYGSEGVIGNIQRQIQEDYDYWFMLAQATETLVDGTSSYDIDYEFKKEIDLRILDQEGYYQDPLTKITIAQADQLQSNSGDPYNYWLDYSGTYRRINLYPTPYITGTDTRTLYMRYWKFLDRLPDNQAAFEATEDDLSIQAPYLLIYKAAAQICITIENYEKMQIMQAKAQAEEQRLRTKDSTYRNANNSLRYRTL